MQVGGEDRAAQLARLSAVGGRASPFKGLIIVGTPGRVHDLVAEPAVAPAFAAVRRPSCAAEPR